MDVGQLQRRFPQLVSLEISKSPNLTTLKGQFDASSNIQVKFHLI